LTTPNGGESWEAATSWAITWTDNINEQVSIDLYKGGSLYYTIISATASNGYYSWQIPDTLQPGSDYRIKITSVDFTSIYDFSDSSLPFWK
jgi:hypothetical protein